MFIVLSSKYRPTRQTYKGPEGETCVVDRVALCSDKNNSLCIKFLIRHTRRPEVRIFWLGCELMFLYRYVKLLVTLYFTNMLRLVTNLAVDTARKVCVEP